MNKIVNRIIAMALSLLIVLSIFPTSYSAEEKTDTKLCYLAVKVLEKTDDGYKTPSSIDAVKALLYQNCVYVDFDWISSALRLRVNQAYNPEEHQNTQNPFLKIFNSSYEKNFGVDLSDISENEKGFNIQKPGKSQFTFYFRDGSDIAYGYSIANGSIITKLNGEVNCYEGVRYVPLAMFLKLVDSGFYEAHGVIHIVPCKQTVMDIMNDPNIDKYHYDIVKDGGLSNFDYALSKGYCDFYSRIKSLFQGTVTLNYQTVLDSLPGSYAKAAEEIAVQYCTTCPDEYQEIANAASYEAGSIDLLGEMAKITTDIVLENPDDDYEFWTKVSKMWIEKTTPILSYEEAESWINYMNSNDEMIDVLKRYKKDHLIKNTIDVFGVLFSTIFDYITVSSMICSSQQEYINAVNEYLTQYDKIREWGESLGLYYEIPQRPRSQKKELRKDLFREGQTLQMNTMFKTQFSDVVSMLEGQIINPFKNKELADSIISSTMNASVSAAASKALDSAFGDILLELKVASYGWDIGEGVTNYITGGTFDALDAIYFSQYNMQIEHDSELILAYNRLGHVEKTLADLLADDKSNEAYILAPRNDMERIEQYRKLEWMCLKSYFLTRENMLAFYHPQKTRHPKEYEQFATDITKENEELLSMMSTLMIGPIGVTQQSIVTWGEICDKENLLLITVLRDTMPGDEVIFEDYISGMEFLYGKKYDGVLRMQDHDDYGIYEKYDYSSIPVSNIGYSIEDFDNDNKLELLIVGLNEDYTLHLYMRIKG